MADDQATKKRLAPTGKLIAICMTGVALCGIVAMVALSIVGKEAPDALLTISSTAIGIVGGLAAGGVQGD